MIPLLLFSSGFIFGTSITGGIAAAGGGALARIASEKRYEDNEEDILAAGALGLGKEPEELTTLDKAWIKDAFVHSYATGRLTMAFGPTAAKALDLNELNPYPSFDSDQTDMDLWNNNVMREHAQTASTPEELMDIIYNQMAIGALQLTPDDPREYGNSPFTDQDVLDLDPLSLKEAMPEDLNQIVPQAGEDTLGTPVGGAATGAQSVFEWSTPIYESRV